MQQANFGQASVCQTTMLSALEVLLTQQNMRSEEWRQTTLGHARPACVPESVSEVTHELSEADSGHCIHSVSECFPIIYFPQAEGLAASQVVEGCPPSFQPDACHSMPQ